MKKIKMLGGMPRSGSTLLMNLLAQNPEIHATATSAMLDVCCGVRNSWHTLVEHKANEELATKRLPRVIRGIVQSYYSDVEQSVVVDKCRGWVSAIEMFEASLGEELRIVVPVRDVRDVLSSFERLWRKATPQRQVPGEKENTFLFQTIEDRCEFFMRVDQPTGLSIRRIVDANNRGYRDRMLFVDYDELCISPLIVLNRIYGFWGLPTFKEHNPNNVEQVTTEDDSAYEYGSSLHSIRSKITPQESQWPTVLGRFAQKYDSVARFWENL